MKGKKFSSSVSITESINNSVIRYATGRLKIGQRSRISYPQLIRYRRWWTSKVSVQLSAGKRNESNDGKEKIRGWKKLPSLSPLNEMHISRSSWYPSKEILTQRAHNSAFLNRPFSFMKTEDAINVRFKVLIDKLKSKRVPRSEMPLRLIV